jgi:oligoribonuclease (3'-5' exoribonuclease)
MNDEKQKQFWMTITDDLGGYVCRKLPFNEDSLSYIAIEVDGLKDFVREYNDRVEGDPCDGCDCFEEGCNDSCDELSYYSHLVCEEEDRWDEAEKEIRNRNPT